jgi:hypothetical protein
MFRSAPIKKGPIVTIDLDSDLEPQRVAEICVSHASAVKGKGKGKGKGKNIVPTVEKGIQIMQAKEKRMNPIWKN